MRANIENFKRDDVMGVITFSVYDKPFIVRTQRNVTKILRCSGKIEVIIAHTQKPIKDITQADIENILREYPFYK